MSLLNTIRNTTLPSPSEIFGIPGRIAKETENKKTNSINVRLWDRHFKHPRDISGIISNDTSIPLVYFDSGTKQAGIIFEDSVYNDSEGKRWIEFCEDYPFAVHRDTELSQFLQNQYYNDFAEGKVISKDAETAYMIPMMLSKIPREVVRVPTKTRMSVTVTPEYVQNKIEITKHLLRQLGNAIMLERVGKKDNMFIVTGVLLGGSIGIVVGIFITFAFLVK